MTHTSWIRRISCCSSAIGAVLLSPAGLADPGESHSSANVWAFTPTGDDIERPDGPTIPGALRAFTPRSDIRRPSRDHTGGSVRGCGDEIVAIAPRLNSVGQTASSNPTFVWYNFSADNDPVEFQLYQLQPDGSTDEVMTKQFETSQQGYAAYTLPAEEARLTVGDTYIWQIVLYCDTAFENPGYYSSAEVDVVALPAEVATALTDDSLKSAEVYAGVGLWYDALAEVYDDNTPAAAKLRQDLLMDLANIEAQSDREEAIEFSSQLEAIAGTE